MKAFSSEATKKHITADFFREHSIAELLERSDYWLEQQGRLVEPVVKRAGAAHYEPISWDDAFGAARARTEGTAVTRCGGVLHQWTHEQ